MLIVVCIELVYMVFCGDMVLGMCCGWFYWVGFVDLGVVCIVVDVIGVGIYECMCLEGSF